MDSFHKFMLDLMSYRNINNIEIETFIKNGNIILICESKEYRFTIPIIETEIEQFIINFNYTIKEISKVCHMKVHAKAFLFKCSECKTIQSGFRHGNILNAYRYCKDCIKSGSPLNNASCVYFILNPELQKVKIGFSENIAQRLKTLSSLSGIELVLLKTIPGGKKKERTLHDMFSHLRTTGEYFEYNEEIKDFISNY